MEKIKLNNIEAIRNGTDLKDSLMHWKSALYQLLIWNIILTIGLLIIIVKLFA